MKFTRLLEFLAAGVPEGALKQFVQRALRGVAVPLDGGPGGRSGML